MIYTKIIDIEKYIYSFIFGMIVYFLFNQAYINYFILLIKHFISIHILSSLLESP